MPVDVYSAIYDENRSPEHDPDGELLGVPEMVELLGVSMKAGRAWWQRGKLPAPDGPKVWGRPTWRRRTFLAWAYQTERTKTVPLALHEEAKGCWAQVPSESIRSLVENHALQMRFHA